MARAARARMHVSEHAERVCMREGQRSSSSARMQPNVSVHAFAPRKRGEARRGRGTWSRGTGSASEGCALALSRALRGPGGRKPAEERTSRVDLGEDLLDLLVQRHLRTEPPAPAARIPLPAASASDHYNCGTPKHTQGGRGSREGRGGRVVGLEGGPNAGPKMHPRGRAAA